MKLELYLSTSRGDTPNLVSLQDRRLDFLPTVLVCPLRAAAGPTAFRVTFRWSGSVFIACCELARPIRRAGLRLMGELDEPSSQAIMSSFQRLLAH